MAKHRPRVGATGSLGTFAGVFTPSVLTILGIILFLRLGYVVGSAGLGRALVILLLANLIQEEGIEAGLARVQLTLADLEEAIGQVAGDGTMPDGH